MINAIVRAGVIREFARGILEHHNSVTTTKILKTKDHVFESLYDDEDEAPKKRIFLNPKLRGKKRVDVPGKHSVRIKSGGDSIAWTIKPGESLQDIATQFRMPLVKLTKLNPGIDPKVKVTSHTEITLPKLSLDQIGSAVGLSGSSGARLVLSKAFDKLTMASEDFGSQAEIANLIDTLHDTAAYEFETSLEPFFPIARKAVSTYKNILAHPKLGQLSPDERAELDLPSAEQDIINLPGFRDMAKNGFKLSLIRPDLSSKELVPDAKKLMGFLQFRSPSGAVLMKTEPGESVRVIDGLAAYLEAGGNLEGDPLGDDEVEILKLQMPVRHWLNQPEYWDWARNSLQSAGYYGIDAKKGLKYSPETGVGQW